MILNYTQDFIFERICHYLWNYSISNFINFCPKVLQVTELSRSRSSEKLKLFWQTNVRPCSWPLFRQVFLFQHTFSCIQILKPSLTCFFPKLFYIRIINFYCKSIDWFLYVTNFYYEIYFPRDFNFLCFNFVETPKHILWVSNL